MGVRVAIVRVAVAGPTDRVRVALGVKSGGSTVAVSSGGGVLKVGPLFPPPQPVHITASETATPITVASLFVRVSRTRMAMPVFTSPIICRIMGLLPDGVQVEHAHAETRPPCTTSKGFGSAKLASVAYLEAFS